MAFERRVVHDARTKNIWTHAGAVGTRCRMPDLCLGLLQAHSNSYMEIKTELQNLGKNFPLVDGKIKPD